MALEDVLQTGQSLFDLYISNRNKLQGATASNRSVSTAPVASNYASGIPTWAWVAGGGVVLFLVVLLLKKR